MTRRTPPFCFEIATLWNLPNKFHIQFLGKRKVVFASNSVLAGAHGAIRIRRNIFISIRKHMSGRANPMGRIIDSFGVRANPCEPHLGCHTKIVGWLNSVTLGTSGNPIETDAPNVTFPASPTRLVSRVSWKWAKVFVTQIPPAFNVIRFGKATSVWIGSAKTTVRRAKSVKVPVGHSPFVTSSTAPQCFFLRIPRQGSNKIKFALNTNKYIFWLKDNLGSGHVIKQAPTRNNVVWTHFREALASIVYHSIVASRQMNYNRTYVPVSR